MKTQGTRTVGSTEVTAPSLESTEALSEETIRNRAYELYLERGMTDGHAEEDWLEAERQIKDSMKRANRAAA